MLLWIGSDYFTGNRSPKWKWKSHISVTDFRSRKNSFQHYGNRRSVTQDRKVTVREPFTVAVVSLWKFGNRFFGYRSFKPAQYRICLFAKFPTSYLQNLFICQISNKLQNNNNNTQIKKIKARRHRTNLSKLTCIPSVHGMVIGNSNLMHPNVPHCILVTGMFHISILYLASP